MRTITFDINGQNCLNIIRGQNDLIYFVLKYVDSPEYVYLKPGSTPIVKYMKSDDTIATINGTIQGFFPGSFFITLTAEETKLMKLGTAQKIQVEVEDNGNNKYVGGKDSALNVRDPWLPGG